MTAEESLDALEAKVKQLTPSITCEKQEHIVV